MIMAPNTKLYVGIGLAVFIANTAYHTVSERISNVEAEVSAMHSDVQEIKQAVLARTPIHIKYNKNDVECLARNIYYEAGIEDIKGKIAVGNITVNRVKTKYWGSHICDVVYAKEQFSWTKEKKKAWVELKGTAWADSKAAADVCAALESHADGYQRSRRYP